MTRVVIVGEIYNADLSVGGGPAPGGPGWGGPVDPGWGGGQRPPHVSGGPIYGGGYPSGQPVPPGGPTDPGYGRPSWGGPTDPSWGVGGGHPSTGPIYGGGYPSTGPIVPPQGGTDVPADEYTPAPPPEEITSQYIVSVWDPKTMTWTTKSYPPR
jgi:hypothetical protein